MRLWSMCSCDLHRVLEVGKTLSFAWCDTRLWRQHLLTAPPPNAGTRERHLESLLQQSLRQLILVKNFPRCLIQVVLQITAAPANEYVNTKLVQASTV